MMRLFVALALAEEIGEELCALTAPVLCGGAGVYPPRDLHLTLYFIGPVPADEVEGIEEALDREVVELAAPRLAIDSTGCFPPRGRPRIWWAGVSERGEEGRLDAVFRAVEQALVPPEERAEEWVPHLTLGRTARRGGEGLGPRKERFLELRPALEWDPGAVTLVESRPDRPGARYRPVATWSFREGPFRGGADREFGRFDRDLGSGPPSPTPAANGSGKTRTKAEPSLVGPSPPPIMPFGPAAPVSMDRPEP